MEFGSDFHLCDIPQGVSLLDIYDDVNLYIDGRQALIDLLLNQMWSRLWVPSYYCYDFLESIEPYIQLKFYECSPVDDISSIISELDVRKDDAVIVMNYFGLTSKVNTSIGCCVIEDHSHDLISDWARNSQADWCFASLRKSLPIADGGILWSPQGHQLPQSPPSTILGDRLADERYCAMSLKKDYLHGVNIDKDTYRKIYIDTENRLDSLPISAMSPQSLQLLSTLDIEKWYSYKRCNWAYLKKKIKSNDIQILGDNLNEGQNPFSLILVCKSKDKRDALRTELIRRGVYPAILWHIPNCDFGFSSKFGDIMLSLHCDGRYGLNEMQIMTDIINEVVQCLEY